MGGKGGFAMSTLTALTAPTRFFEEDGIRFAYRRWGMPGGLPLVFLNYFTGNLDDRDPLINDGFAVDHDVILFNNAGVASSGGECLLFILTKVGESGPKTLTSWFQNHRRQCDDEARNSPGENQLPCGTGCQPRQVGADFEADGRCALWTPSHPR
jgi:pimeloyl-ACP methyl ester carboxylesterase